MPFFKGNDGNLMQHWVLCELLAAARNDTTRLTFIDAHAMAPVATQSPNHSARFDAVFEHLPGQKSSYEQAWQALSTKPDTYPNSANFVNHIWGPPGVCSMLLCECDEHTVSLLRSWAVEHNDVEIDIAPGDWRRRFDCALPKQDGLVFISFDPYMFNRHRCKENPGHMYPTDLDRVVEATRSYSGSILLQLSTYSANGDNSQNLVAESIRSRLKPSGFEEVASVRPNGNMMSLLYQRHVAFSEELTGLPCRFQKWFDAIEHRS